VAIRHSLTLWASTVALRAPPTRHCCCSARPVLRRAGQPDRALLPSRNVDLLRTLVSSGVDLVFCDLPNVPPGAMGRFLLTQMASVAELEAGLTSERTKAALAAAKARGVKLGNPNGARALRGKQVGNKEAVAAIKFRAQEHATNLRSIVDDVRAQGITSIRKIAEELNQRGILAPRGGEWQPTTVVRLLARLSVQAGQL
jgi:DNA invertase Pin-like site-specific DNA recombinase